jgi:hypothetical protein
MAFQVSFELILLKLIFAAVNVEVKAGLVQHAALLRMHVQW